MNQLRHIALIGLLKVSFPAYAQVEKIEICTPVWDLYTEKDGTGLYHELWREIYEKKGIKVNVRYAPFKRCTQAITAKKSGEYDALTAGYPAEGTITPKWHLGVELLTVAYQNETSNSWENLKSLENKRVSWQRGYDFNKHNIVPSNLTLIEFNQLESGVKMLASNRIDFLIDYAAPISKIIAEEKLADKLSLAPDVIHGPKYYMIFSDTPKGRKLAEIWDNGMARLHKSGKLRAMYKAVNDLAY